MAKRRETNLETLFQEALREQIGERRYSMWFGEGVRFVFSDSCLSVRVETSEFLCNWICSAFKHSIEQLCRDFCGRVLPVEFLYVGDGEPNRSVSSSDFDADVPDAPLSYSHSPNVQPFEREHETIPARPTNDVEAPKKRRGRPPKSSRPSDAPEPKNQPNFLFETSATDDAFSSATTFYTPVDSSNIKFNSTSFESDSQKISKKSGEIQTEPRRRRGRPRKNPEIETPTNLTSSESGSASTSAPPDAFANGEKSVPIRGAFENSLANAANVFGGENGVATPGDVWNLSESERVAWATGDFNESGRPNVASASKTPGKRGRKKTTANVATEAVSASAPVLAPTLFDADDEDVSRDERGFNIVKMAANPQNRGKVDATSSNWATLDTFVEGFSNQLAKKVVEVAIVQPATMSPIFIYGPTSVGKTHLLEGVCDRYRRVPNRKPPLLMTAEEFTSAFIQSLRGGGAFRERFRDISLFALDDLHFLEGKVTTQTELLNVVDFLRARRVQMIFAANRPLSELTKLRGELTTRIESGVACKIETPERETLSAIFRQMALERRLVVSDDVCRYVVSRFATHARQLSGALNRLFAAHLTTGAPITLDLAKDALAEMAAANVRNIKLEDVERVVRETFGLDADSLKSKSRSKRCADPRALAMWLARKHTRSALAEIGRYFGDRQHSAVVSAQKKVESWLNANEFLDAGGATIAVSDAVERMERALSRPRI